MSAKRHDQAYLIDVEKRIDGEDEGSSDGLRNGQGTDAIERETFFWPLNNAIKLFSFSVIDASARVSVCPWQEI